MSFIGVDWAGGIEYPPEVRRAVRYLQTHARKIKPNVLNSTKKFDKCMKLIEEHRLCVNCKRFKRLHSPAGDCLFESTQLQLVSTKLSNDPIWRIR